MKVLVVNNMVPFVHGGAEELASHLVANLNKQGFESELLSIPFKWYPAPRLIDEMFINRSLRLVNVDKVIALKFPAYLIPHPNKSLWLLHQYRQAYELWDTKLGNIPTTDEGQKIRQSIIEADRVSFTEAKKIFVNSPTTSDRLLKYNGFNAEILRPPLNDPELFKCEDYENYIFCGGRVNNVSKRQALLVEAMRYVKTKVKMIIAGPPDSEENKADLLALIEKYDLKNIVKADLRFLSREELASYVNNSLACAYIPVDEDSFGYVAMEACNSSKAVITCTDSGGVVSIVLDNESGYVVEPSPKEIAAAIDKLASNKEQAIKFGRTAKEFWDAQNITWEKTIARLMP